jgi:hypothetical protein
MSVRLLLCYIFLLLHLHATAGEAISVKGLQSLQPTISAHITDADAKILAGEGLNDAGKLLAMYMVVNGKPVAVAVAGKYEVRRNDLSFTPLYALGYDMEFEVQYKNGNTVTASTRFHTPKHPLSGKQAAVVTSYPLCDTIPYNTLYFHVRFSHAMMNDKRAYRYIKMYDDKGIERTNAWRQKSFWLDDGKLLVLMIHPGRVKNGIHYESPLFDSGRYYTLTIESDIKDMNGNAIAEAYTHRYYVKGEDRESPRAYVNKAILPEAKTKQPVILSFSEGMDNASVLDGVSILDAKGTIIPCTVQEKGMDNTYSITPAKAWAKGKHTLLLKSAVYDFAANRINRLFEIKAAQDIETDKNDTKLEFIIK